ncbi:MAG: hypothetical protein ACE3JU_25400 [Paenibacillus sp.]|uniref:hypothetical protein n=1 Tax=Paenibacillus sp. TaxID=58172 RepID=UPI003B797276
MIISTPPSLFPLAFLSKKQESLSWKADGQKYSRASPNAPGILVIKAPVTAMSFFEFQFWWGSVTFGCRYVYPLDVFTQKACRTGLSVPGGKTYSFPCGWNYEFTLKCLVIYGDSEYDPPLKRQSTANLAKAITTGLDVNLNNMLESEFEKSTKAMATAS